MLNIHSVLGHAVEIGDFSVVSPNVTINGEAVIGSVCYIGANAFVRNVRIGDGSTVGASSAVVKDVPPNCVVAGVPAIGSNIYGISDAIVDGKTGLLHEVQNTTDLLRCMQQLAQDYNLRTRLGQQARERAFYQFSKERVVGGYVAHITKRLGNFQKI